MTRIRLATNDMFRSLQVRNFRLFFGGQLVSQVGNWLTLVAQTLLVLKLTDSGYALGALAAAQFGPILLVGAFAGLVADRSDKRRLLIVVQALAMVQSLFLAVLGFMAHPPLLAIYAVAVFSGIAMAFDNPARRSFVVEMVPEKSIPNAVSLNSALMTGSRVVGPALAGLLVTTVGFGWCFLLDALSYIAVIAAYWRMNPSELRQAPVTPKGRGQIREGLRYARSIPELWVPLLMMTVIGTLAFNFQTVLPLFVTRDLDGSDVTFTWLLSIVSVGSLAAALAAARRTTIDVAHGEPQRHHLRDRHDAADVRPQPAGSLRHRVPGGLRKHHVHDRRHGHHPTGRQPVDAGPGAGAAGDRLPRQHADRRPDPGGDLRDLRRPVRHRRGRSGHARRRQLRALHGAAQPQGRAGGGRVDSLSTRRSRRPDGARHRARTEGFVILAF